MLSGASLSFCVFAVNAQEGEASGGRYYIAPMATIAASQKDGTHDLAVGAAVAVGASWLPHLGVEIVGDYLRYTHLEHSYGAGIGLNAYLSADNEGLFVHADAEGGKRAAYTAGLGFDRPFLNRAVSLRLEALWHKEGDDDAEPLLRVGLRVPFGSAHGSTPAMMEPVTVVPLEEPEPAATAEAPSEGVAADETSPASAQEPASVEPANEAPSAPPEGPSSSATADAAVEPPPAPPPPRAKRATQSVRKKASTPEPSAPVAPPVAEPEPAMDVPADAEPAGEAAPSGPAAPVPAPPEPATDDALAPTEPAPAPKASDAPGGAATAPDAAPAASGAPTQLTDTDDAPTEPAPKPR